MTDIAKVFMAGRSQAVRLPDAYRIDADEVEISRDGDTLILRPRKPKAWARLTAAVGAFDEARFHDCFPEGREQPDDPDWPDLDVLPG